MSHLRELDFLPRLIKDNDLEVFVETGCGNGDGLKYAAELRLEERYSCDTNADYVEQCCHLGNVYLQDSLWFLKDIQCCYRPTLFWLDAHFPEKFNTVGSIWPLPQELQILSSKIGIEKCVILCDDMHAIQDPLNPVRDPDCRPEYDWTPVEGAIADLVKPFEKTHTYQILKTSTGVLLLEPKT